MPWKADELKWSSTFDTKMVHFFSEETEYTLSEPDKVRFWLNQLVSQYGFNIDELNYIFCSDQYLHRINVEHLNHDTYTDIITFPLSDESSQIVSGDIFISIDRVTENASAFGQRFEDELSRVMAHGVLHMVGFKDKTEEQILAMRSAEENALELKSS